MQLGDNQNVLHTKFMLKRNRNELRTVEKYKARLVVCGNEEDESDSETFLPVVDYTLIKVVIISAVQSLWEGKHLDFKEACTNGKFKRLVYAELPRYMYREYKRRRTALRSNQNLHRMKDAAKIRFEIIEGRFLYTAMSEMVYVPRLLRNDHGVVICYLDGLIVLAGISKGLET